MCLESWVLIVQLIVVLILLVTAIIAGISARASKRAAIATEKSAESTREMIKMQTFAQLLDAYSSPDMLKDMIKLVEWKEAHEDWIEKYGEMMEDKHERKRIMEVHEARRHSAHHFYKIKMMYESNFLDKRLLNRLASPDQIKFLLDTVEPLDRRFNPKYDDSTYRFFENLHR